MEGVLGATISLLGCKVLCSLLCLPVFRRSVSSVSLCCSCLLLFTDFSITVFLTSLWCGAPSPSLHQPSSDVIALRFGLFLGNTYGAVLLLTPPLVAVELLTRLLWLREETEAASVDGRWGVRDGRSAPAVLLMAVHAETSEMETPMTVAMGVGSAWGLKAAGFLGCLLVWGVCGTHAGWSWRQEQPTVMTCLEGGGSLAACLPCLFTASSPVSEELVWALPSVALLLGLAPGLGLLAAGLPRALVQPEDCTACAQHPRRGEAATALQLGQGEQPQGPPHLTRGALCHHAVDSEETAGTSAPQCSQPGHGNRRQPSGNPTLAPEQTGSADSCKFKSENISLCPQPQGKLATEGRGAVSSTLQAPPPCERQAWQAERERPCRRGGMMTWLVCAFLACLCPTVLSTNIALISSLDTLAGYAVQQLVMPPHKK